MLGFSFGQVEAVLAWQHDIADHKRTAFASRLKHLQKNGLPIRDRPGRGRVGAFSFSQLLQVAVAVELIQAGVSPARSAQLVSGNWLTMRVTAMLSTVQPGKHVGGVPTEWLWFVQLEALQDLTRDGIKKYDDMDAVAAVQLHEASDWLREIQRLPRGLGTRTFIINASRLVRDLLGTIADTFKYETEADVILSFEREVRDHEAEIKSTLETLEDESVVNDRSDAAEQLVKDWVDGLKVSLTPATSDAQVLARRTWEGLSVPTRLFLTELPVSNFVFSIDCKTRAAVEELVDHDLMDIDKDESATAPEALGVRLTKLGEAVVLLAGNLME